MDRFACSGWLFIMIKKDSFDVFIKIKHDCHHPAYVDINLPDQWKDYIKRQASTQTPGQVCRNLL